MDVFGKGEFGIEVQWKALDGRGNTQVTYYRYQTEAVRDAQLRSFNRNKKVLKASKATF